MNAEASILKVHAEDVDAARRLLKEAIAGARERWLPGDAIVDALALELVDLTAADISRDRTARWLRWLASMLDRPEAGVRAH
ncbi:MAG: hypothetical protein FJX02_15705 [Alphaproteobacteria bacterium]|nr:hypothetical protein [Alphaproteobacteria bacterium]